MLENDLAEYIFRISTALGHIDTEKTNIVSSSYFNPYRVFSVIDTSSNGYITPGDIHSFCMSHKIEVRVDSLKAFIIGSATNILTCREEEYRMTYETFLQFLTPSDHKALFTSICNDNTANNYMNSTLLSTFARFLAAAAEVYQDIEDKKELFVRYYGICKSEIWNILKGSSSESKLSYTSIREVLLEYDIILGQKQYSCLVHYIYCKPGFYIDEQGVDRLIVPFSSSYMSQMSTKKVPFKQLYSISNKNTGVIGEAGIKYLEKDLKHSSMSLHLHLPTKNTRKRDVNDFFESYNQLIDKSSPRITNTSHTVGEFQKKSPRQWRNTVSNIGEGVKLNELLRFMR